MALKDEVTGNERAFSVPQLMAYGSFLVMIGGALGGFMGNAITAGEYKSKVEYTASEVADLKKDVVFLREHASVDEQKYVELNQRLTRIENLLIQLKNHSQ